MVSRSVVKALALCALLAWIVNISVGQEPEKKTHLTSGDSLSGAELYARHCVACHGSDLRGAGPFPPPYRTPPDLTTLSRRHGGKFPVAYVSKVLKNGVKLPAHGPAEMPIWGTEFQEGGQLDDSQVGLRIRNLLKYIQSMQRK